MSSSQTTSQQGHEHPDHVKVSFGIPAPVIVTLAALTAIAPLGIDMYLASLPTVARELNTTDAAASMTLSAFMIGMALGRSTCPLDRCRHHEGAGNRQAHGRHDDD